MDNGVPLDVRLVDSIDDQQLSTALSGSNTALSYSSYLFSESVHDLIAFEALLRLPFELAVAPSDFTAIESIVQRFYETNTAYPGKHGAMKFCLVLSILSMINVSNCMSLPPGDTHINCSVRACVFTDSLRYLE